MITRVEEAYPVKVGLISTRIRNPDGGDINVVYDAREELEIAPTVGLPGYGVFRR